MRINRAQVMRMSLYQTTAPRRAVNLSLNSDLVGKARAEGLNISALAEQAVAAALARKAHERLQAEIAQACRVHEQYLEEYGSLAEAVMRHDDADP